MAFEIGDTRCIQETSQAILVESPELDEAEWIPQSQVEDESEVYRKGDEGVLIISDWLAEKRGWL